jgi:hypothetical protein
MATIAIHSRDADRLQALAQQENRSVEDLISTLIDDYTAEHEHNAPETARTGYRTKLYAYSRAYWRKVGDSERLALSDEQLDAQFWCIDPDGIPRLISDQSQMTFPDNGLSALLEQVWQDNPTGEIEAPIDYRRVLKDDFADYLTRRMQDDHA